MLKPGQASYLYKPKNPFKINIMRLFLFSLLAFLCWTSAFSQLNYSYIPVSARAPLFNEGEQFRTGILINNYGLNYGFAYQRKSTMFMAAVQHNNGRLNFDPMNFWRNVEIDPLELKHLIQTLPIRMFYSEIGIGYNAQLGLGKVGFAAGLGREFYRNNNRVFFQANWGNETKRIAPGVSVRGNYTMVRETSMGTLEPMVNFQIKAWKFRLVSQFGYSVILKRGESYMKPILSLGLSFVN